MKQMESLGLYSPVVAVPKYTTDRSQPININGQAHFIPPNTLVMTVDEDGVYLCMSTWVGLFRRSAVVRIRLSEGRA